MFHTDEVCAEGSQLPAAVDKVRVGVGQQLGDVVQAGVAWVQQRAGAGRQRQAGLLGAIQQRRGRVAGGVAVCVAACVEAARVKQGAARLRQPLAAFLGRASASSAR